MTERRRPVYLWAAPFAVLLAVLCVRNRFLFTQRLYEQGDGGANSILIAQAKRFTLLTGNYSREGFHHPGPAYMYVQAAGEFLLKDLLHAAPTPWNAHMLAVFALNCGFAALMVLVVYGWTRSLAGALVPAALVAAAAVWQPGMLNSDWMPYMYVVPYLVFVLAVASVAAGAVRDVWIVTLSGWLLIHGHACFLFFVPLLIACAVVLLAWRHGPRAILARFTADRRIWLPAAAISALFLLPIAVNLALHWPGDFGKYLSYGKSGRAGGHGPDQITHYLLWFWWPHPLAWLVALAGYGLAIAAALVLARDPLRPYLLALLVVTLVSTIGVIAYSAAGIDDLSQYYIAYFYWSAPLVTVLVLALSVVSVIPARLGLALGTAAVLAAVTVLAALPATHASENDIDEALPQVVATLAVQAHGRTAVLRIPHDAWVRTTGILVQAERTGVPVCVDDPWFEFLFTGQFICTRAQLASGVFIRTTAAQLQGRLLPSWTVRPGILGACDHPSSRADPAPDAREPAGPAGVALGAGRAGRGGTAFRLLAAVLVGRGEFGQCGHRDPGPGDPARELAAAWLVDGGRNVLYHRSAAIRPARGRGRVRCLGRPRGRRDELHADRGTGRAARQGQGDRPGGLDAGPAGRWHRGVAAGQRRIDNAARPGPHRHRGTGPGHLGGGR